MRIAWDDETYYWAGTLLADTDGGWRMLTDVPANVGQTVTITPITGRAGPHIQFRARVIGQQEDVMVSPFSEARFHTRLVPLDLDAVAEAGLFRVLRAAA